MLASSAKVTEAIKWNNLSFLSDKKLIGFIYTFKTVEYVNLGFTNALSLSDPYDEFEGSGKGMRHIKLYSEKDVNKTKIRNWVRESMKLIGV